MTRNERKKIRRLRLALVDAVWRQGHIFLGIPVGQCPSCERRHRADARYARHVLRHTPPELLVGFLGPDATAEDREFLILNLGTP